MVQTVQHWPKNCQIIARKIVICIGGQDITTSTVITIMCIIYPLQHLPIHHLMLTHILVYIQFGIAEEIVIVMVRIGLNVMQTYICFNNQQIISLQVISHFSVSYTMYDLCIKSNMNEKSI